MGRRTLPWMLLTALVAWPALAQAPAAENPTAQNPAASPAPSAAIVFASAQASASTAARLLDSAPGASAAAEIPPSPRVLELDIHGEIEPVLAEYISQSIDSATRAKYSLILITLDTPGGLDDSMREIIASIIHSQVPVATFVYPSGSRAASAGFFILMSGDVAAMAPGTDTGAASPIAELGGQPMQIDETLRRKIVNEAAAYLRSITTKRDRNPALAETAVTEAKAFSDTEALAGHLIDLTATSPENLLVALNGRSVRRIDGWTVTLSLANATIERGEMTARQKFLSRVVQPDVFFILLIIGIFGIYAEFTHPGMFAPGVVGVIALLLALFAMHMLPVNLTGLLLIALALALFGLEAKFPSHGVLGVGGAISMVLGALMLIRSPLTGMGVSLGTAIGMTLPVALLIIVLMRLVLRARAWKQTTGVEQMIGEIGEVAEPIAGRGIVLVHGELWQAESKQNIPRGARVRVRSVSGLTVSVEPAPDSRAGPLPPVE